MRRAVPLQLLSDREHYEAVMKAVLEAEHSVWVATANLKELLVEDPTAVLRGRRGRRGSYRSVLEASRGRLEAWLEGTR